MDFGIILISLHTISNRRLLFDISILGMVKRKFNSFDVNHSSRKNFKDYSGCVYVHKIHQSLHLFHKVKAIVSTNTQPDPNPIQLFCNLLDNIQCDFEIPQQFLRTYSADLISIHLAVNKHSIQARLDNDIVWDHTSDYGGIDRPFQLQYHHLSVLLSRTKIK